MRVGYRLSVLAAAGLLAIATRFDATLALVDRAPRLFSLAVLTIAFLALLPRRALLAAPLLAWGLARVLAEASEFKIAVTALPVTLLDLRLFARDPATVFRSAGFGAGAVAAVTLASAAVLGLTVLVSRRVVRPLSRPASPGHARGELALGLALSVASIGLAAGALASYGRFVDRTLPERRKAAWTDLWRPEMQAVLSRELGEPSYLAYLASATSGAESEFETSAATELPLAEAIAHAASRYVRPDPSSPALLPNIVVMQAESTFDPNLAFALERPVALPLWTRQESSRWLGALRVNIVGGGSWVSEFEAVVGADTRFFGYEGYYSHYTLAPRIGRSFAGYLAERGYQTKVIYPVEGDFYDASGAYLAYGFQRFVGGQELLTPAEIAEPSDALLATRAIAAGLFEAPQPVFAFLVTSENHGPHPCRHFTRDAELEARFARPAVFQQACALNEYVLRAKSTSAAMTLVLERLERLERETGRPFVLAVYGDHQPWSFTGGSYSIPGGLAAEEGFPDFSTLRLRPGLNETFLHLFASRDGVVLGLGAEPPPLTLLPTLLSAYVARALDDLYLPVNLYAFDVCGSNELEPRCRAVLPGVVRLVRQTVLRVP